MVAYYYECMHCGERYLTTTSRGTCRACGNRLQNIAVPRE